MKKIVSLLLVLVMCLSFSGYAFAAEAEEIENEPDSIITVPGSENSTDDNIELESIISALSKAVTFIYDYITQPEEPAVDLETVLMIMTAIVTVIYTVYQQQNA